MAHTCFGEFCIITSSWDCPNRHDREQADKRTAEEIENARNPIRIAMKIQMDKLLKELSTPPHTEETASE